ncbi:MAG: riboflavin synthase [Bdellovibrionales bacterium]|nr:riboflavin synthase [Bdellovibrionales bacterium]
MFSGIVEATSPIIKTKSQSGSLKIELQKPSFFEDLRVGGSIAVNGVCLTLEAFTTEFMTFTLAAETLHITQWSEATLNGCWCNLERSLKLSDRIDGHFVSGHVDAVGWVVSRRLVGDNLFLDIGFPAELKPMIWKKGSIAVHGVSLTLNEVIKMDSGEEKFQVCVIPETQRQTNLLSLQEGSRVNLEVDMWARAFVAHMKRRDQ